LDHVVQTASQKAQKAIKMGEQYSELSRAIQLLEKALKEATSLVPQYITYTVMNADNRRADTPRRQIDQDVERV
jgi:hypothetical protein